MDTTLKESFERSCRLCAEEQEVTLMIFSEEAEAMLLQNKLNKYLLIEVDQDDKLPKNICIQCCTKLQTVCDFIDQAHRAQDVLQNRSMEICEIQGPREEYILSQEIKSEIRTEQDSNSVSDDESSITPMEISVDPMMVLQNSEPMHSPTIGDGCQIINEDVSHLHGLDGENVTIKLIKKRETQGDDIILSNKPFPCKMCRKSFISELALQSHSWTHGTGDPHARDYVCNICNADFDYKSELIVHVKTHKKPGSCKFCARVFRTEENLAAHMTVHTTFKKSHTCKICGRSYNTLSNLKTHSITHSAERPFQCNICKKGFKRNQDLKFHLNQHTGAKPYKCPFCDKCFASSGNCYSHRSRMHPGRHAEVKLKRWIPPPVNSQYTALHPRPIAPKPNQGVKIPVVSIKGVLKYKCPQCDHTFMKRENCMYHMYQHTGEKPFKCSFCSEKFVTRRGLLLHHDMKHPTKDRPLALLSKNVLLR